MIAFGHFLAQYLASGDVVRLSGGLGAGKSTLARGAISTILKDGGYDVDDIPSPTFTLVQSYPWPGPDDGEREVWHIDLWRLEDPDEIMELGFDEAVGRHAMLIEWPDRLGPGWTTRLSSHAIDLDIADGADGDSDEHTRVVTITIKDSHPWAQALKMAPNIITVK